MTPTALAALVTAAAAAQLLVAFERGEATAANLDAIARAIGNGAAQAVVLIEARAELVRR